MIEVIKRVGAMFISKKRLVSWGSAIAIALGAAAVGMQTSEFKEAVCGAPTLAPITQEK
ncbi:hypothetical protein [Bdellovibrio bacteriovorus]|uniref:hypothetical protein n=1 Tax=Bdellovibrio bacteriovorus TaxID=959 RepID=UPI000AE7F97E|nr:hypothetical protein [Bdellovibrio bacteriovorus]